MNTLSLYCSRMLYVASGVFLGFALGQALLSNLVGGAVLFVFFAFTHLTAQAMGHNYRKFAEQVGK